MHALAYHKSTQTTPRQHKLPQGDIQIGCSILTVHGSNGQLFYDQSYEYWLWGQIDWMFIQFLDPSNSILRSPLWVLQDYLLIGIFIYWINRLKQGPHGHCFLFSHTDSRAQTCIFGRDEWAPKWRNLHPGHPISSWPLPFPLFYHFSTVDFDLLSVFIQLYRHALESPRLSSVGLIDGVIYGLYIAITACLS